MSCLCCVYKTDRYLLEKKCICFPCLISFFSSLICTPSFFFLSICIWLVAREMMKKNIFQEEAKNFFLLGLFLSYQNVFFFFLVVKGDCIFFQMQTLQNLTIQMLTISTLDTLRHKPKEFEIKNPDVLSLFFARSSHLILYKFPVCDLVMKKTWIQAKKIQNVYS